MIFILEYFNSEWSLFWNKFISGGLYAGINLFRMVFMAY